MTKKHNSISDWMKQHSIISALLIGILGSALWEWIIAPASTMFLDHFLSFGGKLTTTISNTIYREISNGYCEQSSDFLLTMFVSLFISFYFVLCINIQKNYSQSLAFFKLANSLDTDSNSLSTTDLPIQDLVDQCNFDITFDDQQTLSEENRNAIVKMIKAHLFRSKKLRILAFSCLIPIFTLFFMVAVQTIYVNKTVTALTNNIEIVSPYISDLEYKKLKSAFHLMNSRADYDSLCDSLNKIADENQLQLK